MLRGSTELTEVQGASQGKHRDKTRGDFVKFEHSLRLASNLTKLVLYWRMMGDNIISWQMTPVYSNDNALLETRFWICLKMVSSNLCSVLLCLRGKFLLILPTDFAENS